MKQYCIGIDTSAYTTSIAVIDSKENKIIYDLREVLTVPIGQQGLRQQDAVFLHLKNFYNLYNQIDLDFSFVKCVSVSSKPRNIEGSYMPVFLVGLNFAKTIAKSLNCNYLEYSHQENHIAASLIDILDDFNLDEEFLAVHLSGGTTEFLLAKKEKKGFSSSIVGGTKDITFGQLIDRIGTMMDFPFPCGDHMERSLKGFIYVQKINKPKISGDSFINLSGIENYYKNIYQQDNNLKQVVVVSLFSYIGECILHIFNEIKDKYNFKQIVLSGGVISNSYIRNIILDHINKDYKIYMPHVKNSSDNAIGVSFLPVLDRWYDEIKTNQSI